MHRKDLPGKPDITLNKYKTVVFVNGCFWHGHPCKIGSGNRKPNSNQDYWKPKLLKNIQRDKENQSKLISMGWRVITLWECEVKNKDILSYKLRPILRMKSENHDFRVASFFAGIGGFDLGFEKCGMKVVFHCEINKFCQQVLKKHWPGVPLMADIAEIDPQEIPDADLWCGGFPCQDLSLANQGKRKGLNGDRSGLFFKFSKLIEKKLPQWFVIENVPGLLNSEKGEDFRVLLQTLGKLGYGISWRILDAKYFGTPQRRRRVYVVGSLGSLRSAEVLFEQNGIELAYRAGLGKREVSAQGSGGENKETNTYSIQHASIGRKPEAGPQAKGYRSDGETYTLDSRGNADAVCQTDDAFGVREATRISNGVDGNRYRAVGNAVAVPVIEWLGKRIMEVEGVNIKENLIAL